MNQSRFNRDDSLFNMKKIYYVLIFGFLPSLIIVLFALNIFLPKKIYLGYETTNYQLEGRIYKLLVADTPEKWERGLMNFRKLEGVSGMIFLFPDKKIRHFWNKNTYLDLDVYWLDDDKVKGKSFLPSIEKSKKIIVISSPAKVNKVVEIVIR